MELYFFLSVLVFAAALVGSQFLFLKHLARLERLIKAKDATELLDIKRVEEFKEAENPAPPSVRSVLEEKVETSSSLDEIDFNSYQKMLEGKLDGEEK